MKKSLWKVSTDGAEAVKGALVVQLTLPAAPWHGARARAAQGAPGWRGWDGRGCCPVSCVSVPASGLISGCLCSEDG